MRISKAMLAVATVLLEKAGLELEFGCMLCDYWVAPCREHFTPEGDLEPIPLVCDTHEEFFLLGRCLVEAGTERGLDGPRYESRELYAAVNGEIEGIRVVGLWPITSEDRAHGRRF